jgi:hypothetical protein
MNISHPSSGSKKYDEQETSVKAGGVISQKMVLFKTTAVRTSNPTLRTLTVFEEFYLLGYNFMQSD